MKNIFYNYQFDFPDGQQKQFLIDFDKQSLHPKVLDESQYPDWALLKFNQCMGCPLTSKDYLYCPVAVNLVPIIHWCEDLVSCEEVDVTVTTVEREVRGHISLQRAISSMLGLVMSSSACPKVKFLRPLARFHLPLATHEETIFRAVSTSFLKSHFKEEDGQVNSDPLTELKKDYQELQNLNRFIAERIRFAIKSDAAVNAIVLLDILSKRVSFSIDDSLQQIRYLFENTNDLDVV